MSLPDGIRVSKTSPSFLHANSTSHTWIFSAFAEIIDNSLDAKATQLYVDYKKVDETDTLTFVDNGCGLDTTRLHHMLSFGFCEKDVIKPVGLYGNGFKSGSMRLGKDAIVFTKHKEMLNIGFLSQTYLSAIQSDTVLVPIVSISPKQGLLESIRPILEHSPYKSLDSLLGEFKCMESWNSGTKIVIFNLTRDSRHRLELDVESNPKDIINSETIEPDFVTSARPVREYEPRYRFSLREYCAILFLKPRMKIFLRGSKVATRMISKSLRRTETDVYRPKWLGKPVNIIFGFCAGGQDSGIMMYHNNRLIKGYERVGTQKQGTGGQGVVGVVEVNFLTPVHNKQDFNKTDRYNSCIHALGTKLMDYFKEKTKGSSQEPDGHVSQPDWTWAQCDLCLKWRRLPEGITAEDLPEDWFCYMNPDMTHKSWSVYLNQVLSIKPAWEIYNQKLDIIAEFRAHRCDDEEETEEEDELKRATYEKTQKRKEEESKQKKRMNLQHRERLLEEKEKKLLNLGRSKNQEEEAQLLKAQQELEQAKLREKQQQCIIKHLKRLTHLQAPKRPRLNREVASSSVDFMPLNTKEEVEAGPLSKVPRLDVIVIEDDNESSSYDDTVMFPVENEGVNSTESVTSPDDTVMFPVENEGVNSTESVTSPSSPISDKQITPKNNNNVDDHRKIKVETELDSTINQLQTLRKNVCELLTSIMPELSIESLDAVDGLVVEIIRVNRVMEEAKAGEVVKKEDDTLGESFDDDGDN